MSSTRPDEESVARVLADLRTCPSKDPGSGPLATPPHIVLAGFYYVPSPVNTSITLRRAARPGYMLPLPLPYTPPHTLQPTRHPTPNHPQQPTLSP